MEARKWVPKARFSGMPKLSDFEVVTEKLPELQNGEVLVKALWLTVDPYMRAMADRMPVGVMLPGEQVGEIIQTKNPAWPLGTKVLANLGWRDLTIYNPSGADAVGPLKFQKLPDLKGLPDSYALGVCGMPGNTAYFGLTKLCRPKSGETLVVSAAAGAVGSAVGQIGKVLGCKVVGFAGTEDKVKWLTNDLGYDQAYNYKTSDVFKTIKENNPQGVDCYFDNVGGEFTYNVIRNMNQAGRIALCGAITYYNEDITKGVKVPFDYFQLIYGNIVMEGFMVARWAAEWNQGITQLRDWILEGKIKVQETVADGFKEMPQAFIDLLSGKNTGKMVIKA